jgi:putative endonuclease
MPEPSHEDKQHFVYVLRCRDGSLYTGYTVDVERRVQAHQAGRGARYTRGRLPVELAAFWAFPTKQAAMSAEYAFKRLTRHQKLGHLHALPLDGGTSI